MDVARYALCLFTPLFIHGRTTMLHLLGFTCDMAVEMSSFLCVCTQTYVHIAYIQQQKKVNAGTHVCIHVCERARAHTHTQQNCCSYIIGSIFLGCPTRYASAYTHMHTYVRTYMQLQPDLLGDICLMLYIHAWHAVKCRYTQKHLLIFYMAFGCSVHTFTHRCASSVHL